MRILYVINSLNIGGAEKLCYDLVKLAQKKKIYIDIYVLEDVKSDFANELKKLKINIFNCGINKNASIRHAIWLRKNWNKYDVVHSHLSYAQYYVWLASIFKSQKCLVTTEHSTFNERRNYRIFKFFEKYIYSKYRYICVINEENKNSIIKWQPTISEKIRVVENGIYLDSYSHAKNEDVGEIIFKDKKIIRLLMVAAFRKEKNHQLIVNAMKDLPQNTHLILVGDGDEEIKKNIKGIIEINGIRERVHFLGNRQDVNNIMKYCDVLILPSLWEGFGLVSIEAMAAGLPVIASNVEGLRENIQGVGILFENNNRNDLIIKINEFLRLDEKEITKIKRKGISRSRMYDLNKTLDKYLNLYQQ